jgi:tetratricopeptide (TPR) repeat protein
VRRLAPVLALALAATAAHAREEPAEDPWETALDAGIAALDSGHPAEARATFEVALARARTPGAEDDRLAVSHFWLGKALLAEGRDGEADRELWHALDFGPGWNDPRRAACSLVFAELWRARGNPDLASNIAADALDRCRSAFEPGHPATAECRAVLGSMERDAGRLAEAERDLRQAIADWAIWHEAMGRTEACMERELGSVLRCRGSYDEAERMLAGALARLEASVGPDHPEVGLCERALAELERDRGNAASARRHARRSLAIFEKALGPAHPETADALRELGSCCADLGLLGKARASFERALAIAVKSPPGNHRRALECALDLARVARRQGSPVSAAPGQRQLALVELEFGPESFCLAGAIESTGVLLRGEESYKEARPKLERGLALREKYLGPDHIRTAESLVELGRLKRELVYYSDARALLERALRLRENLLGRDHPLVAEILDELSLIHEADDPGVRRLLERSAAIQKTALDALERDPDVETTDLVPAWERLATTRRKLGDADGAKALEAKAALVRASELSPP